jgi:hypothetical protein
MKAARAIWQNVVAGTCRATNGAKALDRAAIDANDQSRTPPVGIR